MTRTEDNMSFYRYKKEICDEIDKVLAEIDYEELKALISSCRKARRIMLIGKGRIGLGLKAFSMRLNAIGKEACFLDEVTAFHMTPEDLLVIGNMTGDAGWAEYYWGMARRIGVPVFYITSLDGKVSDKADGIVHVKARAYGAQEQRNYPSCQPMSSTAEQCVWFMLDAVSFILGGPERSIHIPELFRHISEDIRNNLLRIEEDEIDRLITEIEKPGTKCFYGFGRSGIILNSFGMRLYHMGYDVHIYGESGWHEPGEGDLLLVCDCFRKKGTLLPYAELAMAGVTAIILSQGKEAAVKNAFSITVPGESAEKNSPARAGEVLFSEDAFNHALFVALDYIVYKMMILHNWKEADLSQRHANIQ